MWPFLATLTTIAILSGLYFIANTAGPALCTAWLVGFFSCYVIFKCWRQDRGGPPLLIDR